MGEHVCEKSIGSDIERHAEAHVTGPLIEQTMQDASGIPRLSQVTARPRVRSRDRAVRGRSGREGDVELSKHVTRRQGHLLQVGRVPGTEDDASIVGAVAELVDDVGELVDALAGVVGTSTSILGSKVAPLEAVHGAEIAGLALRQADAVQVRPAPVPVPDPDALL